MCNGILYWAIHRWWTTYLQTISYTSYEIILSRFLLRQYFVWSRLWHFDVTFWSRLLHFYINHALIHALTEKLHNFCFENTSQVPTNKLIWLKNILLLSKRSWFFPEIKKKKRKRKRKKEKGSLSLEWAIRKTFIRKDVLLYAYATYIRLDEIFKKIEWHTTELLLRFTTHASRR